MPDITPRFTQPDIKTLPARNEREGQAKEVLLDVALHYALAAGCALRVREEEVDTETSEPGGDPAVRRLVIVVAPAAFMAIEEEGGLKRLTKQILAEMDPEDSRRRVRIGIEDELLEYGLRLVLRGKATAWEEGGEGGELMFRMVEQPEGDASAA